MTTSRVQHGEQHHSEWSAAPLRPVARWVAVTSESGRPRLEMVWAVPEVSAAGALTPQTAAGTATSR